MLDWMPASEDLKWYPHFDSYLSPDRAAEIAMNPALVAKNAFFPLIKYNKKWQPFRTDEARGKLKERPIRYAARRDAYIFAYYRKILSEKYEAALEEYGIQDCPIAYRKIPAADVSGGGKCNIHFAKDAFDAVTVLGDCVAVALDISKFFEHLDHDRLKEVWCKMLGVTSLPDDHFAVFKAVTSYSFVDRDVLYERLGFIKNSVINGRMTSSYTVPFDKMPLQLCDAKKFRELVVGGRGVTGLIEKNKEDYGIPQGTPISDLLANMYLIDFDRAMNEYALSRGGKYFRYSDDILIIIPGGAAEGVAAEKFAQKNITFSGSKLVIKKEKTIMVVFSKALGRLNFVIPAGYQNKNGLEYLGFRFDGASVYLRDSTIANLYRKISKVLYHEALAHVKRYSDKNIIELHELFDLAAIRARFSQVKDFESYSDDVRKWTFWTYARRASEIFGVQGQTIVKQLRRQKLNFGFVWREKLKLAYERLH